MSPFTLCRRSTQALSTRPGRRPMRGTVLLTVLVAVLLITIFISEAFFGAGMELRSMMTYRDAELARNLSRSVLRATQQALLQDEAQFFSTYRRINTVLQLQPIPWQDGELLELRIETLDHLYNLNELANLQPRSDRDAIRWKLFQNILTGTPVLSPTPQLLANPVLDSRAADQLYAAMQDWLDADSEIYNGLSAALGAEAGQYLQRDVEISVKNTQLDRIYEIRQVLGVGESNIAWKDWEQRFSALPRFNKDSWFLPERINVNVASREQIVKHLENRRITQPLNSSDNQKIQEGINTYAAQADKIATQLVAEEGPRKVYNRKKLEEELRALGFNDNYGLNYLFNTYSEYYRLVVRTGINGIEARLEARLHVSRDAKTRIGKSQRVLWVQLN